MPAKASNVTLNMKIIHMTSVTYLFVKANKSASLCALARKPVSKSTEPLRSLDHQVCNQFKKIRRFLLLAYSLSENTALVLK